MNINDLDLHEIALIPYIDTNEENIEMLYKVMRLGVVPGLEIEALSRTKTCSEYRVEGQRVIISEEAGEFIMAVRI